MLADGPALLQSGIAALLADTPGIEVVATASGRQNALRTAAGNKPDVIVYHPPRYETYDETAAMVEDLHAAAGSRVIILADDSNTRRARSALRAGAAGYLLKDEQPKEMIAAIERATEESPWISPQLVFKMAADERDGAQSSLTDREQQVVSLISLGHTNVEAASELDLSVRTIESYRARILDKLNLSSRAELVRYAINNDLFDGRRSS